MQMQNHPLVLLALFIGQNLFIISFAEEGQRHPVSAQRGLDDIGDVALVGFLIKVVQALAAGLLMAAQVVVGAVGDAPQLAPAEGEQELDVGGGLGVEGQLGGLMVS